MKTNQLKRILSLVLVVFMVAGMMPMHAHAAENEPIVLIGGGDYQQAGDHSGSSANVSDILDQIVSAGFDTVDGFLFIGDYDCETHDSSSETSAGIESLMDTVSGVYSNLDYDNTILVQGNHDYADSRIDSTGGHDFDGYAVFVMNEDDYPNGGGSESQAKSLAAELDTFLAEKLAQGYTAPIFVTSHVPLHFGPRTNRQGDGKYAGYIFDVMNAYGAEGLNLIFMHGHNHAYGYDEYLGGEAIYLAVGDQINIAKNGSQSSYDTYTLNFTYMNAGYTGYYNESGYSTSSGTDFLTMTTFEIYEDRVVIGRYSADGIYNLKTAGESKGDYISSVSVSANTTTYASTQTVVLNKPAERVTLQDSTTGITVTGIKVDGTFDDDSDLTVTGGLSLSVLENAAKCAEYRAYSLDFVSEGNVSVTMPLPESFTKNTTKLFSVSGSTLTEVDATISSESVTFLASQGGTYALVRETAEGDGTVYYQRVESVSDLVSGGEYLIIFDCSSQTTSDAIVMPTIATYSSGSSKRMGPDVLVSDGIADEQVITGDYDQYLWALTKSGSGWLIGDGSQNINVTYSSTSSRCELDLTESGEALTIATASSNPSDADSYSFAIYDSDNYYWQYNTSATLIYGTTSDSYTSRFHFYERVENTDSEPEEDKGWVSLPSSGTYVLDTDGMDPGARYIVVGSGNDYALTVSNGTVSQSKVTISDNTVSVDDPSLYEFWFESNSAESGTYLLTQDGSNTVYHANGNMYYGSDNKGYWYVTTGSNGTYKVYDYDNMNWYLNYGYVWTSESTSRFAVSSNTRYVRLFKSTSSVYGDTYLRLAGQTQQNCTAGTTEDQVLAELYIQVTQDGYHISETVAVTSDMVSWDKSFDGNTSGTYTGTVTYEGVVLGQFTVTINSHEHSYKAVVTASTCTEEGYTTYTCECGETYVSDYVDALGHNYETVTVEPTCTEDGSITYTCACGDTYTEVIAATGHSYEAVVTAPTCTEEGYATYTCECGETYVSDYVDALGHEYETVTVEPTCTEDGSITYTCACGDTYTEVIAAAGHSYEAVVTAPTCTEEGYTTYTCECGETYVSDYVEALGHEYETVTVEPTCTADGSITYTCACGDTYTEVIAATGHSYEAIVTAATCTEEGYTTYTCACGDAYIADKVAALGHEYETVTVEATCGVDGSVTHTCHCGDSYAEVIPATGSHSYETAVTAPTCTEGGYTTNICTVCGNTYVSDETAALGHDYTSVTVEPTCTEGGYTTYTCHCGESYVADEVAALGHVNESVITEPTCEMDGYITHTCTLCGEVTVEANVAALGHDMESVTVDATCTADGSVTGTCVRCGETTVDVIPALGHTYESVITAPTCTEGGYTTYTCHCGEAYVADEVAALGHTYETVTVDATCTADGSVTYTCHCGDSYTEVIAALGHSYESVVTVPTCTEGGYTTYTCACGDSYTADEVAALGHSYESVVTAPTCTEGGYTTYTCACGDTYTADEVAALGHSYESVVAVPTCTEGGYTTYTCACGDTYTADEVAALGHSYESIVTAPTCTEGGYTTYTCACGDSYIADEVAALGHSYTAVESDGYMVYTCACGDSYSEKIASTYTQVSAISSGNSYVITIYSGSKYYALSHENNEISVVQVTVSNGEITSEITGDLLWNYDDSKLSYVDNGTTYYMYAGSSSNNWWSSWWGNWWGSSTLSLSSSNSSTVSFSNSKLKVGSYYLRYSNGSVSLNRSATTTYCFIEE